MVFHREFLGRGSTGSGLSGGRAWGMQPMAAKGNRSPAAFEATNASPGNITPRPPPTRRTGDRFI
jgi:hypothetical protein